ncbi:MAG: tetratricopeptide repeat protein [Chitinophagales bacterium]
MKTKNLKTYFVACCFGLSSMAFFSCQNETAENTKKEKKTTALQNALDNNPQVKLLNEQIAKNPKNAELYFTRANVYWQLNGFQEAASDFDKAISIDSMKTAYYLGAAELCFNARQLPQAIQVLKKAQKLLPKDADIALELGKNYFYIQNFAVAHQQLAKAIELENDNAMAYFWQGMTFRDEEKPKEAAQSLEKALELDAEMYNAAIMLAQTYSDKKNDKAIVFYDKAIALKPLETEANYGKAMFLQNNGKADKALAEYRKIIVKNPQHQDSHYNTAYIFYNKGEYEKAYKSFDMAIKVSPAFAKAYYMRGKSNEQLGKKDAAKSDYEKALVFDEKFNLAKKALEELRGK